MDLYWLANIKTSLRGVSSIFCFKLHPGWNWNPAFEYRDQISGTPLSFDTFG